METTDDKTTVRNPQWEGLHRLVTTIGLLTNIKQTQNLDHTGRTRPQIQRAQARVQQEPTEGAMVP
jgi:hypothetical protein